MPPEPALIAKVVEVPVIEHVKRKALNVRGLDVLDDLSGRGYPDILLTGRAIGSRKVAVDVKVARRNTPKRGTPTRTQSRITLGPFDSYCRRPDEPIPGVGVAYGDFASHIDLIVLYDYIDGDVQRIQILTAETWRIASMKRSSTTRNYIGAVDLLVDLIEERGPFESEADFHAYWRSQPVRNARSLTAGVAEPESVEASDLPEET